MRSIPTGKSIAGTLFIGATGGFLWLQIAGFALNGAALTMAACAAMLILGLPHGTLDLQLIARERATREARPDAVLALYLGLAAATWTLWRIDPVVALIGFVAIAVVHFAEDWRRLRSPFLAHGMALATLTAPSILWRGDMQALFVAVAGDPRAGALAELMFIAAPVSMMVAFVGIIATWQERRRGDAVEGLTVLTAMTVLPPAIGFALFFCLFHSPRHFGEALATLSWRRFAQWRAVVVPITALALGAAALLTVIEVRSGLPARMVAGTFMTLAILTVPHMLVPVIVARWTARMWPTRVAEPV